MLLMIAVLLVMAGFFVGSIVTHLARPEEGIVLEPDPRPSVPVRVLQTAPSSPHLSTAPAGMHFVASRRGKKYYPVGSPAAAALKPENRVYFPDAAAAEDAGFIP